MSFEYWVRAITSLALFVSWILTVFSGTILLLKSSVTLYQFVPLPASAVANLHTYAGFVMFGASIIHAYLNRRAISSYIKGIIGKAR